MQEISTEEISKKVRSLKETVQDIQGFSEDFPAVRRNISRIMASIKMLEINVVDVIHREE